MKPATFNEFQHSNPHSLNYESFSTESLKQLGDLIRQSLQTPSGGPNSSSDFPNSRPPSLPRLSPLFDAFLMGWPTWLAAVEPTPCAAQVMELYRVRQLAHLSRLLGDQE